MSSRVPGNRLFVGPVGMRTRPAAMSVEVTFCSDVSTPARRRARVPRARPSAPARGASLRCRRGGSPPVRLRLLRAGLCCRAREVVRWGSEREPRGCRAPSRGPWGTPSWQMASRAPSRAAGPASRPRRFRRSFGWQRPQSRGPRRSRCSGCRGRAGKSGSSVASRRRAVRAHPAALRSTRSLVWRARLAVWRGLARAGQPDVQHDFGEPECGEARD
jgi:hypothetical protein